MLELKDMSASDVIRKLFLANTVRFDSLGRECRLPGMGDVVYTDHSSVRYNDWGQIHYGGAPAAVYQLDNTRIILWFWCGYIHRVGGTAVTVAGNKAWYLFDVEFNEADYNAECIAKTMPQWKEYDEYVALSTIDWTKPYRVEEHYIPFFGKKP